MGGENLRQFLQLRRIPNDYKRELFPWKDESNSDTRVRFDHQSVLLPGQIT